MTTGDRVVATLDLSMWGRSESVCLYFWWKNVIFHCF
jgi:hypothetical protein